MNEKGMNFEASPQDTQEIYRLAAYANMALLDPVRSRYAEAGVVQNEYNQGRTLPVDTESDVATRYMDLFAAIPGEINLTMYGGINQQGYLNYDMFLYYIGRDESRFYRVNVNASNETIEIDKYAKRFIEALNERGQRTYKQEILNTSPTLSTAEVELLFETITYFSGQEGGVTTEVFGS